MEPPGVLHIASLHGGGVDRHVRDIVRNVARPQLVWHASPRVEVLELVRERRSLPLDAAALEREPATLDGFLRRERVGLLHAHSVAPAVRRRAHWLAQRLSLPLVATLHDVLFLRADAFEAGADPTPDAAWLAETSRFLRDAGAVLAPSDYVADLARRHIPGLEVRVVPNGSAPRRGDEVPAIEPRASFAARRPRHVAAVLGAIGPHKGSAVLDELDRLLAGSGIAIVVVGYVDAQVPSGWRGESLFIHGAYQDDEVPALLRAYGARIALFPNRVPESFSYALSDLWDARIPVLVPPEGALGERVRRHGGGWILPPGAGAAGIAAALRERLDPAHAAELAQVESDLAREDDRVPRLDAMARSLDALYARFAIDPAPPVDVETPAIQALLAKNLDGALFREEVARLADEVAQLRRSIETERENAKTWIAKLEGDVAALQAELAREVDARRAFAEENRQMRESKEALELLPSLLRRILLRKVRDARR